MDRDIAFLSELERIVGSRLSERPDQSYTARLAASGTRRVAQKVGEEGVELALAAVGGDRDELLDEAADLVFHLLVLLGVKDVALADVVATLEARHRA